MAAFSFPTSQRQGIALTFAQRFQTILLVSCFLLSTGLFPAADDDDEFRKLALEEVKNGIAVAVKPEVRVQDDSLIVKLGTISYEGVGVKTTPAFRPMRNQLRLELLRQYAFSKDTDRSAAAAFFETIERLIRRQREMLRDAASPADATTELVKIDQLISIQTEAAVTAVAKARGLQRGLIARSAHPGWKVKIEAPKGTTVRYVEYLVFRLNSKPNQTIHWSTAQNGDVLKLGGKYRFELMEKNKSRDFRNSEIRGDYTVRFE